MLRARVTLLKGGEVVQDLGALGHEKAQRLIQDVIHGRAELSGKCTVPPDMSFWVNRDHYLLVQPTACPLHFRVRYRCLAPRTWAGLMPTWSLRDRSFENVSQKNLRRLVRCYYNENPLPQLNPVWSWVNRRLRRSAAEDQPVA